MEQHATDNNGNIIHHHHLHDDDRKHQPYRRLKKNSNEYDGDDWKQLEGTDVKEGCLNDESLPIPKVKYCLGYLIAILKLCAVTSS